MNVLLFEFEGFSATRYAMAVGPKWKSMKTYVTLNDKLHTTNQNLNVYQTKRFRFSVDFQNGKRLR